MKKREFQVGEPIFTSPDGTEPEAGKRFVSLPLTLYDKDKGYGGYADYRPNGFRMYTPDGTEYSPVAMVNHNKKAFQGGFRYKPGEKSEIDLVFLVPEKAKTLVLFARVMPCRRPIPSKLTCRKRNNIVPTPGRRCFYSASSTISTRTPVSPTYPKSSTVGSSYANT